MRLKENPFNVLGVSPEDDISTIVEAAEEKSFIDEENAAQYETARLNLISPQKRFESEVCWFYEAKNIKEFMAVSADIAESEYSYREAGLYFCEKLYEKHSNEEYAHYIEQIDYQFGECDYIEDDVFNSARSKAGIPPISYDEDNAVERQKAILIEQAKKSFSFMIDKVSKDNLVIIANIVAANTIEEKINGNGSYYDAVEKFIELYTVAIQEHISVAAEEAKKCIEEAKKATIKEDFEDMFEKVREFDYIAQPIQLYLQDTGNSEKQQESVDIACMLRDLALYFHNEKGKTELSIAVVDILKEKFSELPAIREIAINDKETLDNLMEGKYVREKVEPILEALDNNIVVKVENIDSNSQYMDRNINAWNTTLNEVADAVEQHGYSKEGCEVLALAYTMIAESYAWAAKFKIAVQYLNKARQWAQKADCQELLNRINKNEGDFRNLFEYDRSYVAASSSSAPNKNPVSSSSTSSSTGSSSRTYSSTQKSNSSDNEGSGCFPLLFCVGVGLAIAGPVGALLGFGLWYYANKK